MDKSKQRKLEELQDFRNGKYEMMKSIIDLKIEDYNIPQEDLDNPLYQFKLSDKEEEEIHKFSDEKQNFKIINLYRYMAPEYGPSNIGNNTRNFCKNVVARTQTTPITYNQILSITPNPGLGQGGSNIYSVFKYRGGSYCKHIWVKYKFNTETMKLVEAPIEDQPFQPSLR